MDQLENLAINRLTRLREISSSNNWWIKNKLHGHPSLIGRLDLESVLECHQGCVNRLSWNQSGSLLASGSDDHKVVLWDYALRKSRVVINTGHYRNIFGVCFVPFTNDTIIASGGMDHEVRLHYAPFENVSPKVFQLHSGRVKAVSTCENVPNVFWSAGEDGIVRQFDIRALPDATATDSDVYADTLLSGVLVRLGSAKTGGRLRAMGLSITPGNPFLMALACGDQFIRLYDRRMLRIIAEDADSDRSTEPIAMFCPPHLYDRPSEHFDRVHATSIQFNRTGSQILVSYHNDHVYLFNVGKQEVETVLPVVANSKKEKTTDNICEIIQELKDRGNDSFRVKKHGPAIEYYSQALEKCLTSAEPIDDNIVATLYGNRAAVYIDRKWRGDVYLGFLDCQKALEKNPHYKKAHYRLISALHHLGKRKQVQQEIAKYMEKYPDSKADIKMYLKPKSNDNGERNTDSTSADADETEGAVEREESSEEESGSDDETIHFECEVNTTFIRRFVGHCNVKTDIKEATFFGNDDAHIVSGSDDGCAFIWDVKNSKVVGAIEADADIVNCVQGHPFDVCLATSGIENVVRLWSPIGVTHRTDISDIQTRISRNQQLMDEDHRFGITPNIFNVLLQQAGRGETIHQCTPS